MKTRQQESLLCKGCFPSFPLVAKNEELKAKIGVDEEIVSNDFDYGQEHDFDLICNMIYVLPLMYDTLSKVIKEECGLAEEMATHKPLSYYVMDDGSVNE